MHIVIYIVNDRKQRIWTYSIGFMLKRLVAREKYNLQFEILHNSFDTFSSLLLPLIQIHFLNNGFSVPWEWQRHNKNNNNDNKKVLCLISRIVEVFTPIEFEKEYFSWAHFWWIWAYNHCQTLYASWEYPFINSIQFFFNDFVMLFYNVLSIIDQSITKQEILLKLMIIMSSLYCVCITLAFFSFGFIIIQRNLLFNRLLLVNC